MRRVSRTSLVHLCAVAQKTPRVPLMRRSPTLLSPRTWRRRVRNPFMTDIVATRQMLLQPTTLVPCHGRSWPAPDPVSPDTLRVFDDWLFLSSFFFQIGTASLLRAQSGQPRVISSGFRQSLTGTRCCVKVREIGRQLMGPLSHNSCHSPDRLRHSETTHCDSYSSALHRPASIDFPGNWPCLDLVDSSKLNLMLNGELLHRTR